MRYRVLSCLVVLTSVLVLLLSAQQRSLKVMLLCDMEGVSGATDYRHTTISHPTEYTEGRKSLTADVNAAIRGLKAAGVTEIVVVDGHGSGNTQGPDVLEDQLLAPAKVHYCATAFNIYMDSYDQSFAADSILGSTMTTPIPGRYGPA